MNRTLIAVGWAIAAIPVVFLYSLWLLTINFLILVMFLPESI